MKIVAASSRRAQHRTSPARHIKRRDERRSPSSRTPNPNSPSHTDQCAPRPKRVTEIADLTLESWTRVEADDTDMLSVTKRGLRGKLERRTRIV